MISITFALATLVAFVHVRQAHMLFNVIAILFIGAAVERQGVAKRIKNGVARMKIIATPARTKMSDETAIGAATPFNKGNASYSAAITHHTHRGGIPDRRSHQRKFLD